MNVVDTSDGPVAVERNGDQMEDRRSTAEHVERHPGVTELTTERPSATDVIDGGQRHDERRDQQIGDRQRRYQIVGDVKASNYDSPLLSNLNCEFIQLIS